MDTSLLAPAPLLPAADRAVLLDWLAGLLAREPAPETVALLAGPEGETALAGLADVPGLGAEAVALRAAARAVRQAHDTDGSAARTLAGRFGTLFLGAGGRGLRAHPHASVYRDGGRTHGPSQERAAAFLAAHDLGVAETMPEPADHVAVMLAALAALAAREAEAADPDEAMAVAGAQRAFATDELMPWLPTFREAVEAGDPSGFYAALARMAERAVAGLASP
ncbi:TorD/DmsD family molecular chaperone [Roseospira navarrensis]|nr:molecular chaperone TorD family protein [Roseospira navarrensis]